MGKLDDERESYWNKSYTKYWKSRVEESLIDNKNSLVLTGDIKTEGDWVYKKIFEKDPLVSGQLLDVGCAWGRLFDLYLNYDLEITGLDISESMLIEAKKNYGKNPRIISLDNAIAENLPYKKNSFNNIVCVAVFDATYQHKALSEFLRVLIPGGKLYLTGKSNKYRSDDNLALDAEIGARKKGHPNFFTNLELMINQLDQLPISILSSYFFPKRGDFADFKYEISREEPFYEWFLVLQLNKDITDIKFDEFSDKFSDTFKNSKLR